MYREHETSAKKGSVSTTQLVLPINLREGVMEVAHDSILGGHLGGKKTLDIVTSNFHWLGVAGDVQRYVQSCDICQRAIPKGGNVKVPLGDMPIIGTPFEKVAIDLFAYREVPQESLKCSPFELLYGRRVRRPMSILRELWTGEVTNDETRTTYQYVMELRERMEETCRLAHEELKKAKVTQKEYYNRKARDMCLAVGDKVLLLLPTDNNKLLLQWKGPYDITQKVAVNDYRIQIGENTKTFHANMLRKYVSREKSEDKIMNDDVVQGLQLVSEDQDSQLGSEDTMFCPLEATESWTEV